MVRHTSLVKESFGPAWQEEGKEARVDRARRGERGHVFIRKNTWQRKDLSVACHMVEKHLERAVDTNPEQVPNQVTELLETELVNTEDSAGKEDKEKRSQ